MKRPALESKPILPAWSRTKGLGTSAKSDLDRWIREDEVLKLLAAARRGHEAWAPMTYEALVLMANLGLRVGEVVLLEPEDFDALTTHNAVSVRTLKKQRAAKITSTDILTLTPEQLARLQEKIRTAAVRRKPVTHVIYLGRHEVDGLAPVVARAIVRVNERDTRDRRLFPHSRRYLQYLFDYYREAARLRVGLSPHALRRFVATRVAEISGDPRLAKKRLRHAEDVTMEHYVQYSPEKQIALLAKVRPVL